MKTKMRIKLLDKNLIVSSDRLVDQDIEFKTGSLVKHKGPIGIEVTLRNKGDIESLKTYMEQLAGELPIAERKVYKTGKKASSSLLDEGHLEDMLKEMERKCKSLDDMVKYLRERNFKFVTSQFIQDKGFKTIIRGSHLDKQFMVRCLKEAKDPKNDKFDPQLLIAVDFMPKGPNAKVYMYDKFLKTLVMEWDKKSDINFKKIVLTKFPTYMIAEERERYRAEERKYQIDPKLEKSKFWLRWNPAVEEVNKKK